MMKMLDSKTGNTFSIILTILLVGAVMVYQQYSADRSRIQRLTEFRAERLAKEAKPSTDWFEVNILVIPDFSIGEDPKIVYSRNIKQPFNGSWTVDIIHVTDNSIVCYNSEKRDYTPGRTLSPEGIKISWFFSSVKWENCSSSLSPGQYTLRASWILEPAGYPVKNYAVSSNVFRILPKGAQPYVTPEQTMQLDKAQKLLDNPIVIEKLLPEIVQ
jgi:hypothetical protein